MKAGCFGSGLAGLYVAISTELRGPYYDYITVVRRRAGK
jgi:hypothetical protein